MQKKVRKAVIPAAGLGTRFLPATKAQPKEMLPIVDKPTLQYIIEETYSPYGEIYYRFKSLLNGATGTLVDTKEEAIKQAENHINLL